MNDTLRRRILRADALFLGLASLGGLFAMDLPRAFFASGPAAGLLAQAPHAAIGFVEAHGLAFILAVLLWRAAPERPQHLTGAAVHALLGTANFVFWQIFVVGNVLAMGYITTGLHWLFVVLQLWAAGRATAGRRWPEPVAGSGSA